ncbi:MAG: hypothetical protein AAF667_20430 [Pseudomonadota bacterium]
MTFWATWWVWVAGALVLAILEIVIPAFLFLGFSIGAAVTGLLMFLDVFNGSLPFVLVVFAVVSLVSWIGLRVAFGTRSHEVRTFKDDINQ